MVDVIVVGGGPAGMGVALNLLRAGREVLILECNAFGGQMATSPRLENIPGIKSISGIEYSDQLFEQITDLGAEFELEKVEELIKGKKVITDNRLLDRFRTIADEVISYQSADFELGEILSEIAVNRLKTEDGNWAKVLPLYIQPPPVTVK